MATQYDGGTKQTKPKKKAQPLKPVTKKPVPMPKAKRHLGPKTKTVIVKGQPRRLTRGTWIST